MPSTGVCDVCAADINAGEGTRYTPREFRLLAARGFAPPRSALRPHDPSLSYEDAVAFWRDHLVAESETDWALCDACAAIAARYDTAGAPPADPANPVTDLDTYLALIHRQFTVARELKDGTPVTGMSADEIALVTELVVDASKPENADHFRAYYELPSTADAYIVVLLGWRLFLTQRAARSGQPAIFAAPDTAGATLSAMSLSVLSGLNYQRWGDLAKIVQGAPGRLDEAVIVGDLDLPQTGAGKRLTNYDGTISHEQTIAFVMERARRGKGVTIFFHRSGWTSPFDLAKIQAALAAPPKTASCFVATACYGSPEHPAVNTLRAYRDDVLRGSAAGRAFIQMYEWAGPVLARWISRRPAVRAWVRERVIAPLAARVSRRALRRAEREKS